MSYSSFSVGGNCQGIAVDGTNGFIYVSDPDNARILKYNLSNFSLVGTYYSSAGATTLFGMVIYNNFLYIAYFFWKTH